ncbi:ADP-dependent NAD(P)H-hydrate dehydratase [Homoserinibacter sp. YIM 151385]|uniref:ADP-dependent NAD(P)H-hydrate dehydratase n=1 Tax=Homoserinibacter sp. YIM 151385 TaxID=2985506 RepID=UPI0022F10723|nr:ADP/ATP-dependent (S)-NAD(P)H-hydrate dehydratase [Homoserinibacter sp. YIM 151385]WBU38234.1 NAD(P)H-hydrate dehydratase [Homoserinibacter sp. YIM 151385]
MTERWTTEAAASRLRAPRPSDDKYSRGVLGVATGSERYPGAAVLGVEAAIRTGVGMLRYLGPERPSSLVLARRPEVVTARGRVQAWVLGSGQDTEHRDEGLLRSALEEGVPAVLDGGALDLASAASGPVVLTPHAGELARLTGRDRAEIEGDPESAAIAAAAALDGVVLLKGHRTIAATPAGRAILIEAPTAWLATAGTGDALAGILGALLAGAHEELPDGSGDRLAELAATASLLHGLAAGRASERHGGGPIAVLDLCAELPALVGELLASRA